MGRALEMNWELATRECERFAGWCLTVFPAPAPPGGRTPSDRRTAHEGFQSRRQACAVESGLGASRRHAFQVGALLKGFRLHFVWGDVEAVGRLQVHSRAVGKVSGALWLGRSRRRVFQQEALPRRQGCQISGRLVVRPLAAPGLLLREVWNGGSRRHVSRALLSSDRRGRCAAVQGAEGAPEAIGIVAG